LFDVIIGADAVKASKPDPEMIHRILNHYSYNTLEDKAWMIGDNSKDMDSAYNAGIEAIFAAWGFSAHGEYHTVVSDPKEILEIVL